MTTTLGVWMAVALYVVANVPVNTQKDLYQPAKKQQVHKVRDVIGPAGDRNSMWLADDVRMRHYTYVFEGRASYKGLPCANSTVRIRLVTSKEVVIKTGMTDDIGRYSIDLNVVGTRYEPVDWFMEAYTSSLEKVNLDGRRIVMREDEDQDMITVHNAVDFEIPAKLPS